MRNLIVVLVAAFAASSARSATAQTVPDLGTRVRITGRTNTVVGPLERWSADSVTVGGRTFGRASLVRFEVSQGRRSHWRTGAVVGALAGAGAALAVVLPGGSTAPCNQSANQDAIGTGACVGIVAGSGVVGGLIGALVGAQFHSERWSALPIGRLGLRAAPSGVAVGLTVRF